MRSEVVHRLHKYFEDYVHVKDGVEFWFARDLQILLNYTQWRNFLNVVEKARESCKNSNHAILDRFAGVSKSIPVPKGGEREIEDIMLTRYACYLIAQNGDPRKEEIAVNFLETGIKIPAPLGGTS
ncbi:MAG: BRO family protein [Methanoregula sp.]|nr:BRO family protein [Methanoregula sp.]